MLHGKGHNSSNCPNQKVLLCKPTDRTGWNYIVSSTIDGNQSLIKLDTQAVHSLVARNSTLADALTGLKTLLSKVNCIPAEFDLVRVHITIAGVTRELKAAVADYRGTHMLIEERSTITQSTTQTFGGQESYIGSICSYSSNQDSSQSTTKHARGRG